MNRYTVLLLLPSEIVDSDGDRVLTFLAWQTAEDQGLAIRKARRECAEVYGGAPVAFPVVAVFRGWLTDESVSAAV